MNRFRAIPPVLAPLPWKDLLQGLFDRSPLEEAAKEAADTAGLLLGEGEILFFYSGRAALVATLFALKRMSPGKEVIVPAYTCYTVPSAVAAAGLVCVPCDISEEHFGFDLDALDRCFSDETLCVIPTYLYGIPWDMAEVVRRAKERRVWIIEDAAQALGGAWDGTPLGTSGDVGLFSLGRGKNVTTGHGGMLLVRDPGLAEGIRTHGGPLDGQSLWRDAAACGRGAALGLLARPPFYGCLESIPALEIGVSRFDADIQVGPLGGFELRLLKQILPLAEVYREIRAGTAEQYRRELAEVSSLRFPLIPEGGRAAWLRCPILLPEEKKRRLLDSPLRHCGLSGSYPGSVSEITGIGPFLHERVPSPEARRMAREILTLPTHPGVREWHVRSIVDGLRSLD